MQGGERTSVAAKWVLYGILAKNAIRQKSKQMKMNMTIDCLNDFLTFIDLNTVE